MTLRSARCKDKDDIVKVLYNLFNCVYCLKKGFWDVILCGLVDWHQRHGGEPGPPVSGVGDSLVEKSGT